MLVLLCIQIVQTNNNESNWREKKKKQLSSANKQKKNVNLLWKHKIFIVNKIQKLIVKEFKHNVNCYIKTSKNHNLPQF
jgi:hypothetical protein